MNSGARRCLLAAPAIEFAHDRSWVGQRDGRVKPFLKWAGNKYQIIETLRQHLPPGGRLIEPFVGSGAVFLNSDYPRYLLADANPDLIALFTLVQQEGESFIDDCRAYFVPENNGPEAYYALRERFNTTADTREKAALFLYLNKHSYNGLCRYNQRGKFNAPIGRYRQPYFPEKELRAFHDHAVRATFECGRFPDILAAAVPGDVVYCDPPYVPLSATANFTSYHAGGFSAADQQALAETARALAAAGIPVIVSNHDTPFTREVYAGARFVSFDVQRYISRNGQNRGKARELLAIFLPAAETARKQRTSHHATTLQPLA